MSERDASSDEMPGFTLPGRPRRERDDLVLDGILDGRSLPPDSPRDLQDLAQLLACVAGPAEPGPLAGEAAARSAFRRAVPPASISPALRQAPLLQPAPRQAVRRLRTGPRRARLAAVLAAVAAVLASATVAAYADVLPAPVQDLAHRTIGAPAAPAAHNPAGPGHPAGHQAGTGKHHDHAGNRSADGPARHGGPGGPGHSGHPARPGHRAKPEHRGKPAHPAHPAHPEPPGHSAHP